MILPADSVGSGPALVLLHAGVADRGMWAEHLGPLADAGHRVLALDLPGFGEAELPEGEQAAWLDVVETMDAHGVERATLVGCSFGAAVAQRVAAVSPERVEALALFAASDPREQPSAQLEELWEAEDAALEGGDVEAAIALNLEAWTLPEAASSLRERLAEAQRRHLRRVLAAGGGTHAADPLEEDPSRVTRIEAPTLLAAGQHDMVDFRTATSTLALDLPDACALSIRDVGHLAPLEAPAEFRRLLLEFAARRAAA